MVEISGKEMAATGGAVDLTITLSFNSTKNGSANILVLSNAPSTQRIASSTPVPGVIYNNPAANYVRYPWKVMTVIFMFPFPAPDGSKGKCKMKFEKQCL